MKTLALLAAVSAVALASSAPAAAQEGRAPAAAAQAPTPRTPDGKPDLSGFWGVLGEDLSNRPTEGGVVTTILAARNGSIENFTEDRFVTGRQGDNLPLYKPEHWDEVRRLDLNGVQLDPGFTCAPKGVPRMGPPQKIIQLPTETVFFQSSIFGHNQFRIIPTDGRPHNEVRVREGTWLGDSVGRWEGDVFVVETIGFGDESWIGEEGYFHSTEMKVTERFRREGDLLHYDVTVEDPEVLAEPFVEETRVIRRNPSPNLIIMEAPPCIERDRENMVLKNR